MDFIKGDKVVCVDSSDFFMLCEGKEYTVVQDSFVIDNMEFVEVIDGEENSLMVRACRFKKSVNEENDPLYAGFCWNGNGEGYSLGMSYDWKEIARCIEVWKLGDKVADEEWFYAIDTIEML